MQTQNFQTYRISPLTLGTVQLGMSYGVANRSGRPDLQTAFGMLDYALANGITAFDTAPIYGNSEEVLGAYFKEQEQVPLLISKFKLGLRPGHDLEKAWKETRHSIQESLRLLQLSKLPMVLYHKAADEPMEEVIATVPSLIRRLKEEGLVDSGGLSLFFSSDAAGVTADPDVEALQIPLNVLDQAPVHSGILARLREGGCRIFIRSVFLQGLFFRNPDELEGTLSRAKPYLLALRELAAEAGLSVAELAFGFIRDLPEVDSLVIGAETPEQLRANIRLLSGPPVPPKIREALANLVGDIPREVITPALWGLKF